MSTLYIGLDDTDVFDSPGTGRLARELAAQLAVRWQLVGVTRHQLLNDPRVPMTARNSANVIHLEMDETSLDLTLLADEVVEWLLAHFTPGSDPGLCLAFSLPPAVAEFGRRAKIELVTQAEARQLADRHNLILRELGGDGGGIIGALAAVGLAATGEDGRFIWVRQIRDLQGVQPVEALVAAGVAGVQTLAGEAVAGGLINTTNKIRPALRDGQPVLLVEPAGAHWRVVQQD
jgi:tRNA(Ile2) C34 agmatinyltransferase TiaS